MTKADPLAPFVAAARSAARVRSAVQVLRALNGVSVIEFEDVDGTANKLALEAAYQKLSLRDFLGLLDGDQHTAPRCSLEIGARFAHTRAAFGFDKATMALSTAMDVATLEAVEAGQASVCAAALQRLVRAGIDANWILTGHGQMRLAKVEG